MRRRRRLDELDSVERPRRPGIAIAAAAACLTADKRPCRAKGPEARGPPRPVPNARGKHPLRAEGARKVEVMIFSALRGRSPRDSTLLDPYQSPSDKSRLHFPLETRFPSVKTLLGEGRGKDTQ
jgi:hypothetical protein